MIEHLKKGNVSYGRHFIDASIGGCHLIFTGIISIIHGLFPFLFEKYVAKTMITYYYRHFHNHPNRDFQEMIKNEKDFALRKQKALYGVDNVEDFEALATINAEYNKGKK